MAVNGQISRSLTVRQAAFIGVGAIALLVFTLITAAHFRVHRETGAGLVLLVVAIASTVVVLLAFALTTLVSEPATLVAIVVILLISIALDVGWKRRRPRRIEAEVAA